MDLVKLLTPLHQPAYRVSEPVVQSQPLLESAVLSARNKFTSENPYDKYSNFFTPTAKTPIEVAGRYNDPFLGYSAFNPDIEHDYADKYNSVLGNLGRGVARGSAKALSTFLGSFADVPDTVKAAGTLSLDPFSNNSFRNNLAEWANDVADNVRTYESRAVAESPFLSFVNVTNPEAMAERWGTVLDNIGFTVGAMANAVVTDFAVGYATGGVGELTLLPKQLKTIGTGIWDLGKTFANPKALSEFKSVFSSTGDIISSLKRASKINNVKDGFRTVFNVYNSAVGEAAIESYTNGKEIKKQLVQDYVQRYGVNPSKSVEAQIDNDAKTAANTTFLANTALLMATNFVNFRNILKPTSQSLREAAAGSLKNQIRNISLDEVGTVARSQKLLDRVGRSLKNSISEGGAVRTALVEGFEEGAQFTISEATKDYWSAKYRGSDTADQAWKSLAKGVEKTLFTREGMENIVMGALSGPVMYGFTSLWNKGRFKLSGQKYDSSKNKAVEQAVALMNNTAGLTGSIRDLHSELSTQADILDRMESAALSGDIFSTKNLKADLFFNWVHGASKNGQLNLRLQALDSAKELEDTEFENFWGIDYSKSSAKVASSYIETLKNKAKEYSDLSGMIEDAFGKNPFNFRKDGVKYQAFEDYKQALAHTLMVSKDSESRFSQLESQVREVLPNVNIESAINLSHRDGILETIKDLKSKKNFLEDTYEALSPSEAKVTVRKEIGFLQEQISNLEKVTEGKTEDIDLFKSTFRNLVQYFNNSNVDKVSPNNHRLDKIFELLFDAQELRKRGEAARNYYNTLVSQSGLDKFFNEVQLTINNKYIKRLKLKDGKLHVASTHDLVKDEVSKAEQTQDKQEVTNEEAVLDTLMEEFTVETETKEAEALVEKALAEKKAGELSEEGAQILETYPETVKRVERREELRNSVGAFKSSPTNESQEAPPETPKISGAVEKLYNLLGNLFSVVEGEESSKEFSEYNEVRDYVENGKEVSPKYTKFILNSPIFKFIFRHKLKIKESSIEVLGQKSPQVETVSQEALEKFRNDGTISKKILSSIANGVLTKRELTAEEEEILSKKQDEVQEIIDYISIPAKIEDINLYRKRQTPKAILYVDGLPLGNISNTEDLMVKSGDGFVSLGSVIDNSNLGTILQIPEYSVEEFRNVFKKYQAMCQSIFNRQEGDSSISHEEVGRLLSLKTYLNGYKSTYNDKDSTLLKDIQALGDNSYILSHLSVFGRTASGNYTSRKVLRVIGQNGVLTPEEISNDSSLSALLNDVNFIKRIQSINSRYMLLNRLPNGEFSESFSLVAARPAKAAKQDTEALFNALKEDDLDTLYSLLENTFIAEKDHKKGSGISIDFNLGDDGLSLVVSNYKTSKLMAEVLISDYIEDAEDFSDIISSINIDLQAQLSSDDLVELSEDSFKVYIPQDTEVNFSYFMDKLKVSTTPYFFNKIKLTVVPSSIAPLSTAAPAYSQEQVGIRKYYSVILSQLEANGTIQKILCK